jgi:hypothetical protein
MKRGALMFVAAFACAVLSSLLGAGCRGDPCDCPATPERPEPQGPLSALEVESYDAKGDTAELDVKPENGTMEVTKDAVIIRYRQAGSDHEIRYDVTGPR